MADKKMNVEIRELREEELSAHEADASEESWQESWGSAWSDPHRRAGGINHISIWRNRGYADVWSWVGLEGKVVGKYQSLHLPLPEDDFPNWSCGGQTITQHSGRSCRMEVAYENCDVDVTFNGYTEPLAFSMDVDGNTWGSSHYEMIGRVDGTVSVGGDPTRVSGVGWQDHSWGPRRWADTMSHRWIMAGFGPDLFISAISIITEAGPQGIPIGFVYDKGEVLHLEKCTFGSRMGDDGHSPVGCDAHIWTVDGHGYHVTGDVHVSSPSSHVEGFWFTDACSTFECGGRLGSGIFEVQELNRVPPWHRGALGLDLADALPAGALT